MKNLQFFLSIYITILSLMVSSFHAFSAPVTDALPPTSTTNITICNNQLPYHWNSLTCLTAGTYTATLVAANGGDSIAILNLAVINVATSITNAIICDNQLPYSWNGNNYTTNGTYSVTLTSSSGCDSVPILSLTVNHVVTSTTNTSICSNQLPYAWNGNNYAAAGTYTVILTSVAGCDSIATLNLTVHPITSSTTAISICNSQLPWHWNGNTYTAAGSYSVTLLNSNGCDSVASLALSTNASVSSHTYITVCSNQLPYNWNGNNYSTPGTHPVTLVSSAGCDSVAILHLTIKPLVSSSTNVNVCNGQLPYNWNGNNYATAGTYSVTLTGSNGCDSIATLHLTSVAFFTSLTNQSVCNSALPYTWNGIDYSSAGTYTASFVTAAGCDSIATLNLTILNPQTGTDSLIVCEGDLPLNWHGHVFSAGGTYGIVPPVSIDACHTVDTVVLIVQVIIPSTTVVNVCSNHLPYTWNGNNYSTTGIYGVMLTSTTGCDSLANLNLTVNAFATSTTDLTICSNQLPYNWNGNNFNSTGIYPVTLASTNGCDSVATLNLTVNPVMTSTTDLTVCSSQLPYSWNGNTYSTNGTYTVTLTSSGGCDSVATLHFIVLPFLASTTNTTICSNQLPYNWNGNSYSTAGTYPVTLTSSLGCDSVATLNLVINDVITSTTNVNTCSNQLPYSWNGNSYPAAGTYSVTLVTTGGCDSVATLNLAVNPVFTSNSDITICNNQLPFSWNGNSYPVAGIYLVTLASSGGCDSVATLNLVVTDILTSTTNVNICPAQLPYLWNGNSYSASGTYSVTMSTSAGCDSVPILSLTVVPYVTSTTDLTICNNELPYTWNGDVFPAAGTYSVLLTGTSVCDSLATLNLSVLPPIVSTTNVAICESELPYSWNGNSYPTAGTYAVTLTASGGCDSVATLNLIVNIATASTTDITICDAQLPYTWNGNSYPSAGTYSVILTGSSGCDSTATLNLFTNPVVTSTNDLTICSSQLPYTWNGNSYPSAGTYSVTLTSNTGCDSIATLNLTTNPIVTSTTDTSICENQFPYSWNGNSYPVAGTYSVTLISTSGCDSVATLQLVSNPIVTSTTSISVCNDELPYSWNGNNYSTAGTHVITLVGAAGCDSVATLDLTINQPTSGNTVAATCDNQLPYSWNGQSYVSSGAYSITLTNSAGCDSIATLDLTVNPVSTSTTDLTICDNQLPYTWNGNSYPAAGVYSVTLTSTAGCDSMATLNLVVNPVMTSTTNVMICDNQLPYTWNGNSYPTAGTYSVNLTSSNGCDSIATLNLTANAIVTSTTNITICNNQLPYTWNGNSYPVGGAYSVTLTSSVGCDSIASLNLTADVDVTSITDITICNNQLPYSWNGNNYPTAGSYSVTLTSSGGCDSIATLNLTANAVVTSTTDITICNNQLPYSWNGNSYPAAGTYSVTLTSSGGCDSIATLNLTSNAVVTSTSDITICDNQLPYSWNGNGYPTAGTFSVILTSSTGCDSIATLNLTVNPVVTSTSDITICNNQLPYSWNGNSYPAAGTYSITLTSSAGCDSIATLNLTANTVVTSTTDIIICNSQLPYSWNGNSYPAAGTYSITLTSSTGCDSIATLNLTANTVVTSTSDITICSSQLPYSWNGNSYPAGGTYSVTLTSSAGCDSIATLNLIANATVTSTTDITICSNQLPYTWNGNSYPTASTYSITLTSAGGCDSIATLNLTANAVVTSTTDITICNNQLPYSWNGNSYPAAGTYTVTLTSSGGCDSIATLNLTANAVVTSTTDITICNNQLPYSWNSNSYPAAGTYPVTLTGSTGCDSIATLNLTANSVVTSTTDITICSSQLPFSWNGNSYPSAGTYSVTLTSAAGCDSIATLNLAANSIVTSNSNITICNNQLPYSWNGNSYPTGGSYSITLTSAGGCDSIATLNLVANPVVTSSTNITVCDNQLPYTWNGNSYPVAGTYSITLTSAAGCDSIATMHLVANPVVTSTTTITICDNQLPYAWNGNSYPSAGVYSFTLTGNTGCDSIATLNLVVNPVMSSTTNITICNDQLPYSWNGNNYPVAGTYPVALTSADGCDSIATLMLIVHQSTTSTTIVSVCENQLPYSWNGQNYTTGGNHSITLTNAAGCDSTATLQLTVNAVTASTTNASICSAQLPYTWNGQNYTTAGTHVVTLINAAGCDSVATLDLIINQTPAAPAVSSPVSYCQYDITDTLAATITTANAHLVWYTTPVGGTGSLTAPVPSSANAGITNYYVSQVDGPCEGPRAVITVTVNSKPELGPDQLIRICFGQTADLSTLYNTSGYTFTWTHDQATVANLSAIGNAGLYQLIVQNNSGCPDTAHVNLAIQPPVTANAGSDGDAEYNAPYQLYGSGGGQYQWSPGAVLNNAHVANPVAILTENTTFVLMVLDDIGCFALDTVKIRVLKGPTFYVPSAFSPNGDGLNDIFRPTPVGISSIEFFRVFNRYGELVYETHDIGKGWDGTYKGVKQNIGNYVWSLKGTDRTGKVKTLKGNVVLIRQ